MLVDREKNGFAWREAAGNATGTRHIVFLHGLGGSRVSWDPQLLGLCDVGPVAAWDMPGYGSSAPLAKSLTFANLADAVVRFADVLETPTVHLVGHSMGAMIAQYAAAAHPTRVDSLTLISTSPKFGLDGTEPDEWRRARLAPLDGGQQPTDFAERVLGGLAGPSISTEAFAAQVAAMQRITSTALRSSIDCLITHDTREVLPNVTCPVVCAVGELDHETPPEYSIAIAERCTSTTAEVVIVKGAGHLLPAEAPEEVNDIVRNHVQAEVDTLRSDTSRSDTSRARNSK